MEICNETFRQHPTKIAPRGRVFQRVKNIGNIFFNIVYLNNMLNEGSFKNFFCIKRIHVLL